MLSKKSLGIASNLFHHPPRMQSIKFSEIELSVFEVLNKHQVEYLLIGGCALRFFGMDREIEDVDLFINRSPANARKLSNALVELEAPRVRVEELEKPKKYVRILHRGVRFDMFTSFDGIDFSQAFAGHQLANENGVRITVMAAGDLIAMKERLLQKTMRQIEKEQRDIEFLKKYPL
jgi:predicted nucleotidyltransferase